MSNLNLATLVLQYESAIVSQESIPDDGTPEVLDDQAEVIVPGRLWEAWLRQARLEADATHPAKRAFDRASGEGGFPRTLTHGQLCEAQGIHPARIGRGHGHDDRTARRNALIAPKPYDLGIIACSAAKSLAVDSGASKTVRARHLYTGDLFKLSLAAAERLCSKVVILSAFHGVVDLDQHLGWYDRKLPTAKIERRAWASRVSNSLRNRLRASHSEGAIGSARVLMLAPQSYAKGLYLGAFPRPAHDEPQIDEPLKGLGIGKQKQQLKNLLADAMAVAR